MSIRDPLTSSPQVLSSPGHARHDGSGRNSKNAASLAVTEALDNHQPESLSTFARQDVERGQSLGDFDAWDLVWLNSRQIVVEFDGRASPTSCTKAVQMYIPHDPKEPSAQTPGRNKEMRPGQSSLQAVLKEVLGPVGIPLQSTCIAPEGGDMGLNVPFESAGHDYLPTRFGCFAWSLPPFFSKHVRANDFRCNPRE
jgi:hypothetical protein